MLKIIEKKKRRNGESWMKSRITSVIFAFLLCVSISACTNNKSSSNPNNSSTPNVPSNSKIENTKTPVLSENKTVTITAEKILNILSTKNKDVIDSLSLSDSDKIKKSKYNTVFYEPVFQNKDLGILIGFSGFDSFSIDDVKEFDETPEYIIPNNDTIIKFDNKLSFCVGDDFEEIKHKLGEGISGDLVKAGTNQSPEIPTLTYDINGLSFRFTSREGNDFKKYDVFITKLQFSTTMNPTSVPIASKKEQYSAMEAYKAILQNKLDFYDSDCKKQVYLDELLNGFGSEYSFKIDHFTVLDLDGDRISEVYLEVSRVGSDYIDLYVMLHYTNGNVYGCSHGNKGFSKLKTDGTFRYSSGVSFDGYAQISFNQDTSDFSIYAYREASSYNDELINSYFINNKRVTEESYKSFAKKQDEKNDVVWYEFSQKNIETILINE